MINLSEQQLKIVNSQEKHVAVVAGAGSGKTRVVIEKIKKIISENKRNKKVLAITFSNKAANEMRDRLLESYSQEELEEKVFVGTIHNFCLNIVRERANVIGINGELRIFESDKERKEIFKTVVAEYNLYNTRINDEKSDMYFAEISKIKRSFINGYRMICTPKDRQKLLEVHILCKRKKKQKELTKSIAMNSSYLLY